MEKQKNTRNVKFVALQSNIVELVIWSPIKATYQKVYRKIKDAQTGWKEYIQGTLRPTTCIHSSIWFGSKTVSSTGSHVNLRHGAEEKL